MVLIFMAYLIQPMSQQAQLGMYFGVNVHTASLFFAPASILVSKDALPDLR